MNKRARRLGFVGSAAGLVLVAGVIVAPPAATAAVGCSSLNGLTVTGPSYSASAVSLNAGDRITATASPASSTSEIMLSGSTGLNIFFQDGSALTGLVFTAPAGGSYNLSWSWDVTASPAPAQIAWSFTSSCSSAVISPSPAPTVKTPKGKGRK